MKLRMLAICAALLVLSGMWFAAMPSPIRAQGDPTPTPLAYQQCERALANLTRLLIRDYAFEIAPILTGDYCTTLEAQVNLFLEEKIFKNLDGTEGIAGESKDAFSFVDYAAQKFVGVMPSGTQFVAVARNGLPGSQMMLVKGEGFSVFVDYVYTTLSEGQFAKLPDYRDYDGTIETFCRVTAWCRDAAAPPKRK